MANAIEEKKDVVVEAWIRGKRVEGGPAAGSDCGVCKELAEVQQPRSCGERKLPYVFSSGPDVANAHGPIDNF